MIAVERLTFSYPHSEFRLSIPELYVGVGEKLAVIGPSGSGKTTLLNLVSGIIRPQHGQVRVADTDLAVLGDARRRAFRIRNIGFVFQDFELIEYLNVLDNVLHPYRVTKALKLTGEVRECADSLLRQMGLGDKRKRGVERLSQGEKQRVAICRALLPSPPLVLADEATGNLDPRNKGHILDLLFKAVQGHGSTLLAVTHDHELLPRFDRTLDFTDFLGEASNGAETPAGKDAPPLSASARR